jgi:alpha-D-xyloside xylohydrolase
LLPYLYSLAADVHFNDATILKGIMMEFPADKKVETINDQYMCGPSLLVNPVYHFKDRSRKLYLPAGSRWFDLYSNKTYTGGQTIIADAPINNIPVFVKQGSIIITGPVMQYSTERPADSLTVTVYGKKDASFILYEDENENYNYEQGKYATIAFRYNAAKNTLTLQASKGSFEGMLTTRVFKILLWADNPADKPIEKWVQYSGNELVVSLSK